MQLDVRELPTYYINLAQDTAKDLRMQEMLASLGFKNVTRFEAIKGDSKVDGCSKSHYHLLGTITAPCLVLEDDCILNKPLVPSMDIPNDTEAFYFGNSSWGRYASWSGPNLVYSKEGDFYRVYNMLATHAILYLSDEYRDLSSRIAGYEGYEAPQYVDIGLAEIQKYFNVYCEDVPLFTQYQNVGTEGCLTQHGTLRGQAIRTQVGQYLPSRIW